MMGLMVALLALSTASAEPTPIEIRVTDGPCVQGQVVSVSLDSDPVWWGLDARYSLGLLEPMDVLPYQRNIPSTPRAEGSPKYHIDNVVTFTCGQPFWADGVVIDGQVAGLVIGYRLVYALVVEE